MAESKIKHTRNGYTSTGLWGVIDSWIEKLLSGERRRQRAEARLREEAAAKERTRRENTAGRAEKTAAAFDKKMIDRRRAR